MTLDPKTQEVWCGVRRLSSMVSELQSEIDELRATLSGFDAYQKFARSQESFQNLEDNLVERASQGPSVSESDVRDGVVPPIESNVADWPTYLGDSNAGLLSRTGYDDYRTYLTNNGLTDVEADRHTQILKDLFDPDSAFASDTSAHQDWDALETELENNGVSASSAATTVDRLRSVFISVGAFDRRVLGSGAWSDVETYLDENGLTSAEATAVVDDLKTAYGTPLGSAQKDNFSEFDSFAEFEQYLVDQGFSQDKAQTIVEKIKNQYSDFDTFRAEILATAESLEAILNAVDHAESTSEGGPGLRVFEEAGTTAAGVSVPAGSVELKGKEVHFSQVGASEEETTAEGPINWTALDVDPLNPFPTEPVDVRATVENTSQFPAPITAKLIVDGEVLDSQSVQIRPSGQTTVGFEIDFGSTGSYDVQVSRSPTKTVLVNNRSGL